MLWNNRALKSLTLANCQLGKVAAESIGEGLTKNSTLYSLDISENSFPAESMQSWGSQKPKKLKYLKSLDMSGNHSMGKNDVQYLLRCFRNLKFQDTKVCPNLRELNLKDTNMSEEAAKDLLLLLASNTKLVKINVENNSLPTHYAVDIGKACKRNKIYEKENALP